MSKNITLDILLARKQQSENDKMKVVLFNSEVLGGTIEVVRQRARDVIKIMDNNQEGTVESGYNKNYKLIYKHCPIFKEKELQKAYEVADPYEIIIKVFDENLGEVNKLTEFILGLYGLAEDKKVIGSIDEEVEDLKN